MNIKHCESVPGQGIAKLKRHELKPVYSICKVYSTRVKGKGHSFCILAKYQNDHTIGNMVQVFHLQGLKSDITVT